MCVFENRLRIKHGTKISTSLSISSMLYIAAWFLVICFPVCVAIVWVDCVSFGMFYFFVCLPIVSESFYLSMWIQWMSVHHRISIGRSICRWICFVLEIVSFIATIGKCIAKQQWLMDFQLLFFVGQNSTHFCGLLLPSSFFGRCLFSFFLSFIHTFCFFILFPHSFHFVCVCVFRVPLYENVLHIKKNQIVATIASSSICH